MNKQGISATTKGCCTACDKPIVGQVPHPVTDQLRLPFHVDYIPLDDAGGNGPGSDVASRALCVRSLPSRAGHQELFRARWTALLRAGLPSSLFTPLCLLQRSHPGRKKRVFFPFLSFQGTFCRSSTICA